MVVFFFFFDIVLILSTTALVLMFVVGFEFNPASIRKIETMRNINKAMVEVADVSQSFTFEDPEILFRTKFPYIKKYMNLSDAAKFKTPPTEPAKRLKFEVDLLMAKKDELLLRAESGPELYHQNINRIFTFNDVCSRDVIISIKQNFDMSSKLLVFPTMYKEASAVLFICLLN